MKYTVRVSRRGPQSFRVLLGASHVDVVARKLNDGGLIIQVRGLATCMRACEIISQKREPLKERHTRPLAVIVPHKGSCL